MGKAANVYVVDLICGLVLYSKSLYVRTIYARCTSARVVCVNGPVISLSVLDVRRVTGRDPRFGGHRRLVLGYRLL